MQKNSDRIRELRKKLQLSQGQFSKLFAVHPQTVSKWERSLLFPSTFQCRFVEAFEKAVASDPMVRVVVSDMLEEADEKSHFDAVLVLLNQSVIKDE